MRVTALVNFFIHPSYHENSSEFRRARLFVRSCLLTSLFSITYIFSSAYFEFLLGVYLMVFNAMGFLLLPFLAKTRIPIPILGNIYVAIGAIAVVILTYFSGGMWSGTFPWIISIPLLAILVVNRASGIIWGALSFIAMQWFCILAYEGEELPLGYNLEMKTMFFMIVLPGLLLITFTIALVFEGVQRSALKEIVEKNRVLNSQKKTITNQAQLLKKNIDDRDYLIKILAHDLKNPLSNITSLTGLMGMDERNATDENFIKMIGDSARNAQDLIVRVMEMAKSDGKEVKVDIEELNIGVLINDVLAMLNEIAKKKNISLDLIDQHLDVRVKADRMYLSLIIENLISNAIKFSNNDTLVELKIEKFEKTLHILVQDQGPGINSAEEGQLFKQFAKLSTQPTGGESSSGLGLSLVKRYAELIECNVWYDKEYTKGARFVVELEAVN